MENSGIIDSIADIPALEQQKDALVKALKAIEGELWTLIDAAGDAFNALKKVPDADFLGFNKAYKAAREEVEKLTDTINRQAAQQKALEGVSGKLADVHVAQRRAAHEQAAATEQQAKATAAFTGAVKSYTSVAGTGNELVTKAIGLLGKYGVSLGDVTKEYYKHKSEHKAVQSELKKLEKEYDGAASTSEEYAKRLLELTTQEGELSAKMKEAKTNMAQLQKATIQSMDSDKQRGILLGQLREVHRKMSQEEKDSADGRALLEHIQELDVAVKQSDASIGNFQRNVGNYQLAVEGLQKELAEATAEIQRVEATLAAGSAAYEQAKQQADELAATMQKMEDEGKKNTEQYAALASAMQRMEAEGKANTAQYNAVADAMARLEAEGKANTQQYADMQRSLSAANAALERQRAENEAAAKAHGDLQKSIAETNEKIAVFAGRIADATKDVAPMRTRLKELKQEANELYMAMNDGTATDDMVKRFNEVTQEAARLEDTIGDVSSRVKRMASDTFSLDAITEAIKGSVSAFQVFEGAMAMAGVESETFEQVMTKLAAAQSIVNGLTEVGNALNRDSALRTKINTLATSQNVVVKKLATVAQKALNAAMKAAPYMLAVAAIAALVAIIYKFAKGSSEAAQQQKALNDLQKEGVEISKDEVKSLAALAAAAKLNAAGTSERAAAVKRLNEQYGDYLPTLLSEKSTVEEITAAYERLTLVIQQQAIVKAATAKVEEYARERIELYQKEAAAQEEVAAAVKKRDALEEDESISSQSRLTRRLSLDAKVTEAEQQLAKVRKGLAEEQEKIGQKELIVMGAAKTAVQQLADMRLRDAAAAGEQAKAADELQKLTRKLEDVQLSAYRSEEELQRKALALSKKRAVEDFEEQKKSLSKTADEKEKNAAQIAKIDALIAATGVKHAKDAAAMEEKFRHEAAKAAIGTRLLLAKEGSAEELQARKDLVDEELRHEILNLPEYYEKRKEAEAKAAKEKEELDRAAAQRARDMALDEVSIRLEYAKKGGNDELSLTVQKLELERDAALAEAEKTGADVSLIRQKWAKRTADAVGEWAKAGMDNRNRAQLEALALAERQEQVALTQRFADGLASQEEYEREKQAIANRYAQDGLRMQIGNLKEIVAGGKITDEQRKEAMQELAEFEMQLDEQVADGKSKHREQQLEQEKRVAEQLKELAKEVAAFAMQLVNQQYEARVEALEAQKEDLQAAHDEEIANIEASGYSEEEAEARKRSAAAQTKAAQDKIDEQVKEEKRKQAVANKAAAIAQAAISTALAILNIWATVPKVDFGVSTGVLTGIAAAIGAVQVAAIAAQPIPKYAGGRHGGKEEWAIVGEAGAREVVAPRRGMPYLTPDVPTLAKLGAGDDVFPSVQDYLRSLTLDGLVPDFVKAGAMPEARVSVDLTELVNEQRRQTQELKEAIKGQSELQISSTRRGVYMAVKSASGATRSINFDYNNR